MKLPALLVVPLLLVACGGSAGNTETHEVRYGEVEYSLPDTPGGYELDISTPTWIGEGGQCGTSLAFALIEGGEEVARVSVDTGNANYFIRTRALEQEGPTVEWARKLAATVKVKLTDKMTC